MKLFEVAADLVFVAFIGLFGFAALVFVSLAILLVLGIPSPLAELGAFTSAGVLLVRFLRGAKPRQQINGTGLRD